jgi:hypothetical protein
MELEDATVADLRAASRQHGVVVKLRAADAESSKQRRLWRSKHAWLHGPTVPLLRTCAGVVNGHANIRIRVTAFVLCVIGLYAPLPAPTRLPRCCAAPSLETPGHSHNPASRHSVWYRTTHAY